MLRTRVSLLLLPRQLSQGYLPRTMLRNHTIAHHRHKLAYPITLNLRPQPYRSHRRTPQAEDHHVGQQHRHRSINHCNISSSSSSNTISRTCIIRISSISTCNSNTNNSHIIIIPITSYHHHSKFLQ
uniref:Putative secreted peptide n=1 Tax=Anopheles braziliensis TaxID=58242 RepID=A0A2M3ZQ32_9DIPT